MNSKLGAFFIPNFFLKTIWQDILLVKNLDVSWILYLDRQVEFCNFLNFPFFVMKMCYIYILALFIGCVMVFVVFLRFINIIKWKISDPWLISDVRHTVSHFHDTKHSSTRYKSSKLHWHSLEQEIIKVRGWIVYIGLIAMVIPVKLFLNRAPGSSMDITRAMRGQAKWLSRNYRDLKIPIPGCRRN